VALCGVSMNSAMMFSKASDEWTTPDAFFAELHREFRFQWDAAATRGSAKCGPYCYFGPDHGTSDYRDALSQPWREYRHELVERLFCNPPYSQCAAFVSKAAAEAKHGATSVLLIPSRTDTRYWHAHVWDDVRHCPRPGVEVRFIKGRLKFGQGKNSAPFPSVVVIFRPVAA
jgi:site-specific DNA-methyltransferase (adenine-specific)